MEAEVGKGIAREEEKLQKEIEARLRQLDKELGIETENSSEALSEKTKKRKSKGTSTEIPEVSNEGKQSQISPSTLYKEPNSGIIDNVENDDSGQLRTGDISDFYEQKQGEPNVNAKDFDYDNYLRQRLETTQSTDGWSKLKHEAAEQFKEWKSHNKPKPGSGQEVKRAITSDSEWLDIETAYKANISTLDQQIASLNSDGTLSEEEYTKKKKEKLDEKNKEYKEYKKRKAQRAYNAAFPINEPDSPNRRAMRIKSVAFVEEQSPAFREELRKGLDDFARFADNLGMNLPQSLFSDKPGEQDLLIIRADKILKKGICGGSAKARGMVWISKHLKEEHVRITIFHEMIHWLRDIVQPDLDNALKSVEKKIMESKLSVPHLGMKKNGESLSYFMELFIQDPVQIVERDYSCMNTILSVLRKLS